MSAQVTIARQRCGGQRIGPYTADPEFKFGLPELLFDQPYEFDVWGNPVYDVTADGSRFIMITTPLGANQTNQIRVVLNWDQEIAGARQR